jgi:L-threonylcarbamoyladenylate synthase
VKLFRAETVHDESYEDLVTLLRDGRVIAFPTDTAYGLGADPFNESAINRVYAIKGRPETKPILLLVDSLDRAASVIEPTAMFYRVAEAFWPGPLTIITHAAASVPVNVTAGTKTIGLRWPMAAFATTLVGRFGKPITATSANKSGLPSAVTAHEVRSQLGDSIDALVDGGALPSRIGSTLLDLTVDPAVVLREGPLKFETLAQFFDGKLRRWVA